MGIFFSKLNTNKEIVIEKEYIQQEKLCTICATSIEDDSYIHCKTSNNYYHYSCLEKEKTHLLSCEPCREIHQKIKVILYCIKINNDPLYESLSS